MLSSDWSGCDFSGFGYLRVVTFRVRVGFVEISDFGFRVLEFGFRVQFRVVIYFIKIENLKYLTKLHKIMGCFGTMKIIWSQFVLLIVNLKKISDNFEQIFSFLRAI